MAKNQMSDPFAPHAEFASVTNSSPRQRFLLDGSKAQKWADIASSLLFAEVCDVAMLEIQSNTPTSGSMELNAASELRRQGAALLVIQLKTLCKLPDAPTQRVSDNLTRV